MIAFASLFLGLIVGTQPVQVLVGDAVHRVEYHLDGALLAEITSPPWRADVAFGEQLAPHELVATAFDAEGSPVAVARQWINLPRGGAEGRLVIRAAENGHGASARLAFESVTAEQPTAVRVLLDGEEIAVDNVAQFDLPRYDPESLHYLRVELEFGANIVSIVEATFGGTYAEHAEISQMAVPILVSGETRPGFVREIQGRFTKSGEAVQVLGVDEGPAEVILVRDKGAQPAIDLLARLMSRRLGADSLRFVAHLRRDQRVRFLSPFAERSLRPEFQYELFASSEEYTPREGGIFWFLLNLRPEPQAVEGQRLADAVAVAGMTATKNNYRRAVVLLLGEEPVDSSRLAPEAVRNYLESVRVPLFVWTVDGSASGESAGWGEVEDVSSVARLERQVSELGRFLERQRIVWLEGIHLPQMLSIRHGVPEITIAM
jgi:hypothetical protein